MEKRTIQDIAAVLVEKNGLEKRSAEQFAQAFFAVISEGLERDGQVKVRGLGTFKIVEVGDRESVSVSTGERVLIQGHAKVTFTPDATMKELVNKPFSQFETVPLNEGVNFDDMASPLLSTQRETAEAEEEAEVEAETEEAPIEAEAKPEADTDREPVAEPETEQMVETVSEPEPEPEPDPEPEPEQEPESEQEPEQEQESETEQESEPEQEPEQESEPEQEPKPESPLGENEGASREKVVVHTVYVPQEEVKPEPNTWNTVLKVLGVLLLLVAAAAGGYYFGYQKGKQYVQECEVAIPAVVPVDTTANDTMSVDSTATTAAADTVQAAPQPEQQSVAEAKPEVQEEKPTVREEKPAVQEEKPAPKVVEDKWEKADPRLRYGAYRIVGEDFTIKVRPGETTARMAKRTLGSGMECYIEAFNGIKSNADLKEGQTVKIPKLELKKKRKK